MYKYIFINNELLNYTQYKTLKRALEENLFTVRYFPRENKYCVDSENTVPESIYRLIAKDVSVIYPGATMIN